MEKIFQDQKAFFLTEGTLSYQFRLQQLQTLKRIIIENEALILKALKKDLNKSEFEAYTTEIGYTLKSISKTIKKLKRWMKPKRVKTPFYIMTTKSRVMYEPKGVVLIIGPYNYPFQLIIEPLIGAIAAGNTAILKPSEFAGQTEKVLLDLINKNFDSNYLFVVTGDHTVTQELLKYRFDHIFFTGSTRVGQIVYEAASKNLIPVTLELGGKSPTIIDETANLEIAARRIAFGKFINAGQTCIAPDYIYVHELVHDAFIEKLYAVIKKSYVHMDHFGRIINTRHFNRLKGLIDEKKVVEMPVFDPDENMIGPTILKDVTWQDKVMQEEIFGPILPVLKYNNLDELIKLLKQKEKPLALYLFSNKKSNQQKVFRSLSFGGGAINDTLMHVSNPYLPFGGVGQSGIGAYHGFYSFQLFSHMKGYIHRGTWLDVPLAYPPHSKFKTKLIRKILK